MSSFKPSSNRYRDIKKIKNNSTISATYRAVSRSTGKSKYFYSDTYKKKASIQKFKNILHVVNNISKIRERYNKLLDHSDREKQFIGFVIMLIDKCLFRPGSIKSLKNVIPTYGAKTIRPSHLKFYKDTTLVNFKGKLQVHNRCSIRNSKIRKLAQKLKKDPSLFGKKRDGVLVKHMNERNKPKITARMLRTYGANVYAIREFYRMKKKGSIQKDSIIQEVGKKLATKLHNTPKIAINHYMHPGVKKFIVDAQFEESLEKMSKKNRSYPSGLNEYEKTLYLIIRHYNARM